VKSQIQASTNVKETIKHNLKQRENVKIRKKYFDYKSSLISIRKIQSLLKMPVLLQAELSAKHIWLVD
jgi:hypothetical protein